MIKKKSIELSREVTRVVTKSHEVADVWEYPRGIHREKISRIRRHVDVAISDIVEEIKVWEFRDLRILSSYTYLSVSSVVLKWGDAPVCVQERNKYLYNEQYMRFMDYTVELRDSQQLRAVAFFVFRRIVTRPQTITLHLQNAWFRAQEENHDFRFAFSKHLTINGCVADYHRLLNQKTKNCTMRQNFFNLLWIIELLILGYNLH